MAFAHDARQARLPGHQRHGVQIAHGHEIRPVRLDAHAADGEAREAGAIGQHRFKVGHGHGLGLGHAVDVDELGQHVADAVGAQVLLGLLHVVKAGGRHEVAGGGIERKWHRGVQDSAPSG